MNILLTNDCGLAAPGIWAAARALAPLATILMVAPASNFAGYGTALPPQSDVTIKRYTAGPPDLSDIAAYVAGASPSACVEIGLSGVLGNHSIDLVVSGISSTLNLGHNVFRSGAVGAAITAHLLGVPAIAASLDVGDSPVAHWETAASALQAVVDARSWNSDSAPLLYNLNIPNEPLDHLKGVETTSLSSLTSCHYYHVVSVYGKDLRVVRLPDDRPSAIHRGTDAWAVAHGRASLTPLRLTASAGLAVSPAALQARETAGLIDYVAA